MPLFHPTRGTGPTNSRLVGASPKPPTITYGTRLTEKQLDRVAEGFERGEIDNEPESAEVIETDTAESTATISIRLPLNVIAALKSAAAGEGGGGATVLGRQWISERLATTEKAGPTFGNASDLVQWIVSHARAGGEEHGPSVGRPRRREGGGSAGEERS